MKEEWRPMFDGQFEISSHGRVRRGGKFIIRATQLQPMRSLPDINGYPVMTAWIYGKKISFKIHFLVAWTFLGPRPRNKQINHKDGNKRNNHAENLEYVTASENMQHAVNAGLLPCGERNVCAKLTERDAAEIKTFAIRGEKLNKSALARHYNVSIGPITHIFSGRSWKKVKPLGPDEVLPKIDMSRGITIQGGSK